MGRAREEDSPSGGNVRGADKRGRRLVIPSRASYTQKRELPKRFSFLLLKLSTLCRQLEMDVSNHIHLFFCCSVLRITSVLPRRGAYYAPAVSGAVLCPRAADSRPYDEMSDPNLRGGACPSRYVRRFPMSAADRWSALRRASVSRRRGGACPSRYVRRFTMSAADQWSALRRVSVPRRRGGACPTRHVRPCTMSGGTSITVMTAMTAEGARPFCCHAVILVIVAGAPCPHGRVMSDAAPFLLSAKR